MTTEQERDHFGDACDLVAGALPEHVVTYEYPGFIQIDLGDATALVFGTVNETINANELTLRGDMWDEGENSAETLALLDTDVPSDSTNARAMADAVVAAVRRYREPRP